MKQKGALALVIGGAVLAALSLGFLVIGILDYIERSQYQNVGPNTPVIAAIVLGIVAGIVMLIVGIRKRPGR